MACRAFLVQRNASSATEDGSSSKSRKESGEMKRRSQARSRLMRHDDSLEPRVQDRQVEYSDRCKAAAARSA